MQSDNDTPKEENAEKAANVDANEQDSIEQQKDSDEHSSNESKEIKDLKHSSPRREEENSFHEKKGRTSFYKREHGRS